MSRSQQMYFFQGKWFTLATIASVLAMGSVAIADQPRLFDENPDPQELAEFLFPKNDSRSWSVVVEPENTNVAALQIHFEFDSVDIVPKSIGTIERLAQALITKQAGSKPVMIEGHTDATGGQLYNLDLSKRRAYAIRDYLIGIYKIDPERLFVDGLGESELLTPEAPAAAINRRVQIRHFATNPNAAGSTND